MKKHFTVSPKLSSRRVTASADTEDEILITKDFVSKLYGTLMNHCNCAGGDADVATNNLYHNHLNSYVDRDDLTRELAMSMYNAAIGDGVGPDELVGWMDTLWDTVPDAIDDALK